MVVGVVVAVEVGVVDKVVVWLLVTLVVGVIDGVLVTVLVTVDVGVVERDEVALDVAVLVAVVEVCLHAVANCVSTMTLVKVFVTSVCPSALHSDLSLIARAPESKNRNLPAAASSRKYAFITESKSCRCLYSRGGSKQL